MMTRRVPVHQIVSEHELSRSYQPSNTGIAAYYQAEQTGGLAVCPPPLHRVNSNHHVHGESPAEEVRIPMGAAIQFREVIYFGSLKSGCALV
jgi:hypothetical protein